MASEVGQARRSGLSEANGRKYASGVQRRGEEINAPAEPPVIKIPALDGVRAIGIILVLLFHGGLSMVGGGFFGVDVFFVLSGFLITALLVAEFRRERTLRLLRFWGHRVRRLLPALLAMLLGVCLYVVLLAPDDTVSQIRGDGIWTMLYANNWHLISQSQGYFAGLASPRPLLHTWSLSIEEQFYVIWPLVVLGILRLTRSLTALLVVAVAGAVVSAVEMSLLFNGGSGLTRVYYGTDTRAQAVLIGAALAIALARPLRSRGNSDVEDGSTHLIRSMKPNRAARGALLVGGVVALIGIGVISGTTNSETTWVFHGGFALVSVLTALLIASVALLPASPTARLLSLRPIAYIGAISYGLYLWHWPIFVVLSHDRTHLGTLPLLVLRLAVTFGISALSYRFLEMPIRRRALRGWKAWTIGPAAVAATASCVLAVTAGAAPALSSYATIKPPTEGVPKVFKDLGTDANVPSIPQGTDGPIRLLLLGNSEASFLAFGLGPNAERFGIDFAGDGVMGCGLIHSPSILHGRLEPGVAGERPGHAELVPCATQEQRWAADVASFNPDVVLIVDGAYDVRDHKIDGSWVHLGQRSFDQRMATTLRSDIEMLSRNGATVALMTAPYYHQPERADGSTWPEDDPARVDSYNHILRQMAAEFPGTVLIVDAHAKLSPHGRFTQTIDGVNVRFSDGIHVTPEGARWMGPWVLRQIEQAGKANRHRQAATPTTSPG
jgi:peptidoglycan/LPS O-acetylase OafA/YrhL/lysophospholipase L1-like esterase